MPPWEDIPLEAYSAEPSASLRSGPGIAEPGAAGASAAPAASRERDAAPVTAARPAARDTPAPATALATLTREGDRWAALVAQLVAAGAVTAMVRELALQSECVAIGAQETELTLRVERETLRNPAHAERLQAALAAALNHPVRLDIEAGPVADTPARREAAAREQRQREAEALIRNDPLVLDVMAQFKTARIVPGSIKPV